MRYFLLFIPAFLICSRAHAVHYPSLEQVATKLYANYSVPQWDGDTSIAYQKKREGWFVVKSVFDTVEEVSKPAVVELFWSSASGKYNTMKLFPKGMTPGFSQLVARDKYSPGFYDFERCPYYGYTGWYTDVILDYGNANNPPANDTLAEGLARAYNALAMGYLDDQYGWYLPSQKLGPEKERIDKYVANAKQSIGIYDMIRKRNPHFKVLVGEVTTKYANEIMAHYEVLMYYHRETELNTYFKEDLYDPFMRGVAQGMLENCAQNGILFTNGDNDTFPLWYMQWIKGVRKDVAVMNMSLMNMDKYLDRYRTSFRGAQPVQFTIGESLYAQTDLFLNLGASKAVLTPESFLNSIAINTTIAPGDTFVCFDAYRISVEKPGNMLGGFELIPGPDAVTIQLGKSYLLQGDMAVLDVLLSNYESRGIYFSCGMTPPSWISSFVFSEGLVQRFIPAHRPELQYGDYYGIASAINAGKEMNEVLGLDTTCVDRVNAAQWITNIKLVSVATAKAMINARDTAGGVALLNRMCAQFPFKTWAAVPVDYYILDAYYSAKAFTRGDEVGSALVDQAKTELQFLKGLSRMSQDQRSDYDRWLQVLDMIVQAARKHARVKLAQDADAVWKAYK